MTFVIIAILLVVVVAASVRSFLVSVFILSFLPKAIGMFDGNISTMASNIPIISKLVEGIVNWISVIFINVIDFVLWFIYWIPGVKNIIKLSISNPTSLI